MSQHQIVWNPEQAERLAKFAHAGQTDKVGEDYFNGHLYDVVQILKYGVGTPQHITNKRYRALSPEDQALAEMIAWLHDSSEDVKGLSVDTLMRLGAPYELGAGVAAMTRPSHHSDWSYLTKEARTRANVAFHEEIKADPVLLAVKEADLASNTHPRRVRALAKVDPEAVPRLAAKYAADREALGLEDPWN